MANKKTPDKSPPIRGPGGRFISSEQKAKLDREDLRAQRQLRDLIIEDLKAAAREEREARKVAAAIAEEKEKQLKLEEAKSKQLEKEETERRKAEDKIRKAEEKAADKQQKAAEAAAEKQRKADERSAERQRKADEKSADKQRNDDEKSAEKQRKAAEKAAEKHQKASEKSIEKQRKAAEKADDDAQTEANRVAQVAVNAYVASERQRVGDERRAKVVNARLAKKASVLSGVKPPPLPNKKFQVISPSESSKGLKQSVGEENQRIYQNSLNGSAGSPGGLPLPDLSQHFDDGMGSNGSAMFKIHDQLSKIDQRSGFQKLVDYAKEQNKQDAAFFHDSLETMLDVAKKSLGMIFSGKIFSILGMGFTALKKVFTATWDYLDQKVLPTQSLFNKTLGTTTANLGSLKSTAMGVGNQFEDLGLGFEHGTQDVAALAAELRSVNFPTQSLLKMSEYVGVGAKQAGEFARTWQAGGGTLEGLDKVMKNTAKTTRDFDVPVNLIRKDMLQNIPVMVRFGTANSRAFAQATAKAQELGLSVKDMFQAFGEGLDTFENTSDVAANLNQIFGTNIDSVSLLNETDINKRYEMIASSLRDANVEWDTMGNFMQNIIKDQLKINDEQGVAFFGSQKQREENKKRMAQDKANMKLTDDWDKAMNSLRRQVLSVDQVMQNFFLAIGNVVGKFFGFKDGIDATKQGLGAFKGIMGDLTKFFNDMAAAMPVNNDGFGQVKSWMMDLINVVHSLSTSINAVVEMYDTFKGGGKAVLGGALGQKILGMAPDSPEYINQAHAMTTSFYGPEIREYAEKKIARAQGIPVEQVRNNLAVARLTAPGYNPAIQAARDRANSPMANTIVLNNFVGSDLISQTVFDMGVMNAINASTP